MNKAADTDPNQETGYKTATAGNFRSRRLHFLGLDSDDIVKAFFGGNATLAIIVLLLIMFFLFKEGSGFAGQNATELVSFRQSGLEYVDLMRSQLNAFNDLPRHLSKMEAEDIKFRMKEGDELKEAREHTKELRDYTMELRKAVRPLDRHIKELSETSIVLRDAYKTYLNRCQEKDNLQREADKAARRGNTELENRFRAEAAAVRIASIDVAARRATVTNRLPEFLAINAELRAKLGVLLENAPAVDREVEDEMRRFRSKAQRFIEVSLQTEDKLRSWDAERPMPFSRRITSFLFGRDWVTNSYFQDWYGVLPLLYGSVVVSFIALFFAVPLGIAGAVYVNQFASHSEQKFIKPYIEFISAIPSVVIGFFGVIVWGQFVREASGWAIFSWIPGFPISERLNAFTAGCLLALMAIPTIFTLAEDALNNVPKAFKEASLAVGATRLQTTIRIVIPTALSGMISAVLLGFGRVIGETMVVLLCAGNRISIPDFSDGFSTLFQPVHTMTGIVAQEMGEVVSGSIHYRALFLVGTLLFFISLAINYMAQKIMRRYSIAEK